MAFADLYINEVLMPGPGYGVPIATWEWGANWEERIDGAGQAQITIQDRPPIFNDKEYGRGNSVQVTNPLPGDSGRSVGWRDVVRIKLGSQNLYWGEVVNSKLGLPTGHPYRRWAVSCTDWNTILDLRYVGLPDGLDWQSIDGGATHEAIDPNAKGLARDGATVQALFDNYVELPLLAPTPSMTRPLPFETFDTTTYVRNWIPRSVMIDPATGESRLQWTGTTLRSALDEMRSLASFPLFCWIDPDLAVHWEALPNPDIGGGGGSLPLLSPRHPNRRPAPVTLVDTDPDHDTSIGFRDLEITYDGTYMPQQAYINGVTDYLYNGGSTIYQGTGYRAHPIGRSALKHYRQIVADAEAVTDREKAAVAGALESYGQRARVRGSVKVGSRDDVVDGWRVGQLVKIYDARLPPALYGKAFPIQAVKGQVVPGNEFRTYTLEFGDFPIARFSQKYRSTPQRIGTKRLPARKHRIYWPTHNLRPSTSYILYSQMVDQSDKPVRRGAVPIDWTLTTVDGTGATVSTGSLSQHGTVTDEHGRSAATLTTGPTTDLHYHVRVRTVSQG